MIPIGVNKLPESPIPSTPGEFNFRKADFTALNSYIQSIDWNNILSTYSNVNDAVDAFYDIIIKGFNDFVPLKRQKPMIIRHGILNV